MTAEGNKVADDLEKALGDLSHMAEADTAKEMRIRDARMATTAWGAKQTKPTPPMNRLAEAAAMVEGTLEALEQLEQFLTGTDLSPAAGPKAVVPAGVLPAVSYHAETVITCMDEIRRIIDRVRAAA